MLNDEIVRGFSLSAFLQSEKSSRWNEETRRCYTNILQDLLEFTRIHGEPTPQRIAQWQAELEKSYSRGAVNVHLTAANNYFKWCGRYDLLCVHAKPAQDEPPSPALTRSEYIQLLRAARSLDKRRTYLLIKLFATTDLPLQCLDQVTADLIRQGNGTLHYRSRTIPFHCPAFLQQELLSYMTLNGIYHGPVFVTRRGKLLERTNIFRSIQELCQAAGIPEEKGNPRSLRNLYKSTQQKLDEQLAAIKQQMYDQMLATEQHAVAWPEENSTNQSA